MKLPPLQQQTAALLKAARRPFFAYFMDVGTGKTYTGLAEAEHLFKAGLIRALLIIAPSGVHRNWCEVEIPKHLSIDYAMHCWDGSDTKKTRAKISEVLLPRKRLIIFAFNVEAFSNTGSRAEKLARDIMIQCDALMAVDESSTIKTPSSQRTKRLCHLGKYARFRRILTGTAVTERPMDYYAQFRFLQDGALGHFKFATFKAYYATWEKKVVIHPKDRNKTLEFDKLLAYRNMAELKRRVDALSYTVRKADCLDLPQETWETRLVELAPAHRALLTATIKSLIIQIQTEKLTLAHTLTRLTRQAQIVGGHIMFDDAQEIQTIEGGDSKLNSMMNLIEEIPSSDKIIIWARFVPEIHDISKRLQPGSFVQYFGEITADDRAENIRRFTNDAECRFFVGTQRAGKYGFTLTAANQVIYFSNDFSYEARYQSEARVHRIGQTKPVTYTDMIVPRSIDVKIQEALRSKHDMANYFKSPADLAQLLKEWIS